MRHDDWGVRSSRWAGLHSVSTSLRGVPVHHVRAEPTSTAAADAPVHLLVPPMTGSASMWLDVVPHLARLGPVISVDLPGTVAGDTGAPHRYAPGADRDASFVRAFVGQLVLDRPVVLHGWSTGGLVAALAAGMLQDAPRGVVLWAPALPWRRTSPVEGLLWQTVGRLAVAAGPSLVRVSLVLAGPRILDAKLAAIEESAEHSRGRTGPVGGHPARVSREQVDLWLDGLEAARSHPERLAGTATAFASAVDAMFVSRRRTNAALDRLRMPVLVLWGSADPLVDPASLTEHASRPAWTARPVDDVGHLLPVEAPDDGVREVGRWLAETGEGQRAR